MFWLNNPCIDIIPTYEYCYDQKLNLHSEKYPYGKGIIFNTFNMSCLLLGGSYSVGKSEAIYRTTQHLLALGFVDVLHRVPPTFKDFMAVLEGFDQNKQPIRIVINTATDTPGLIHGFKNFYNANGNYDILISSVRDHDFWPRRDFFAIMGISHSTHHILEIPLGKVTRKGGNFTTALGWYQSQLDNLIKHTLHNHPYYI